MAFRNRNVKTLNSTAGVCTLVYLIFNSFYDVSVTFFLLLLSSRKIQILLLLFLEAGFQGQAYPFSGHWASLGYMKLRKWGPQGFGKSLTLFQSLGVTSSALTASALPRMKGLVKAELLAPSSWQWTTCLVHAPIEWPPIHKIFLKPYHKKDVFTSGSWPFQSLLRLGSTAT